MKQKVHSHTSKIGHLPYEIRYRICSAMYYGIPGARLVAWLNSLPEVQAILQEDFGGRPINRQNFSQWKVSGYPDWLQETGLRSGQSGHPGQTNRKERSAFRIQ